jgi:hypothetical protein
MDSINEVNRPFSVLSIESSVSVGNDINKNILNDDKNLSKW